MPLINIYYIKVWLKDTIDNLDFMEKLTDEEKWYYVGILLLRARMKKLGKNLENFEKFGEILGKKLAKDGKNIGKNLENIMNVVGWKIKNNRFYIPDSKRHYPWNRRSRDLTIGQPRTREQQQREEQNPSLPKVSPPLQGKETLDAAVAAIQQLTGNQMTTETIQTLIEGRDPKEMVNLARRAKRRAKTNAAGYFRKLVEEKTEPHPGPEEERTRDIWLDLTPDRVVALVKERFPGLDNEKIKPMLIKIHEKYNLKYEPVDFHKWKWDMDAREVENMVNVAKEALKQK